MEKTLVAIAIPLTSLIISTILTTYLLNPRSIFYILDHPNDRSLHSIAIPRMGGLAIVSAILISFVFIYAFVESDLIFTLIVTTMVAIATLSYFDDKRGLPIKLRLSVQIICALLLSLGGIALREISLPGYQWVIPFWISIVISVVFIVWMINLYNFMDGMDGFAAGMAVVGFASLSILGYIAGHNLFFISSLVIATAAAGFLIFNFPPARIFMGDTGSASLGLLAGAFSLWGSKEEIYPFWISLIIFSPFILDATVTLLKRLIRGEVIWQAHKSHYYQRLVEKGWGHKRTVLFEYGIMIICAIAAIIATRLPSNAQWVAITVVVLMYTLLAYYFNKRLSY